MESSNQHYEELKREEQKAKLRLAAIQAAIGVYEREGPRSLPSQVMMLSDIPPGAPSLDGLRLRDAITIYLRWAQDNGRDKIQLGELKQALLSQKITTFRGKPIAGRLAYKTICNSLGSPENRETWVIEKHSEHYQDADLIGLRPKQRAERTEDSGGEPSE